MSAYEQFFGKALRFLRYRPIRLGPDLLLKRWDANEIKREKAFSSFLLEQHLRRLLSCYEVNCVLDVGANNGQYATRLRRLGYKGHIISFEPVQEAYQQLCELSNNDSKWDVHQLALGSKNMIDQIHVTQSTVFSSFHKSNVYSKVRYGNQAQVSRTEQVEVKRLDTVLGEVSKHIDGPRFFLKMDTQGSDLDVFAGLGEEDEKIVGLQSEMAVIPLYEKIPRLLEAIAHYEAFGFEITGLFPLSRDKITLRSIEIDCVMVRARALPSD